MEAQKGIFLVNRLRLIFMRLLYNSNIDQIENHLADSNIGGRKNRSARDHLFILHSVINECKYGKSKTPTDITFKYIISQCFDIDLSVNSVSSTHTVTLEI